jgi:outer membrane protein assembly factor BamB
MPLPAGPLSAPVIADGLVSVALESGIVVAFRAADGVEAWRVDLAAEQPLAADGGMVLVAAAGAIHAVRADDHGTAWRVASGALTAPMLAREGWLIVSTAGELMALRIADGALVWKQPIEARAERAAIEGDRLYVPLADGRIRSLELDSGTERWVRRLGGAPTEVLAFADRVYVSAADRYFYALDARDGSILWPFRVGAGGRGRPAAQGTLVYTAALDNLLRAFDRNNGARRWDEGLPFRPIDGPVMAGRFLIVSGRATQLPSFDPITGAPGEKLVFGATLAAPIASTVIQGMPVVAAVTGDAAVGWTVTLFEPRFGLRTEPLTALPGEVVPIQPIPGLAGPPK